MALSDMDAWVARARTAVDEYLDEFESRMGYPPESNLVIRTSGPQTFEGLPHGLDQFLAAVDELSWPDMWNGYFLGPAAAILKSVRDPFVLVSNATTTSVVHLGSDGGGNYFVLDSSCGVISLIRQPLIHDETMTGESIPLAPDLDSFLEALVDQVHLVARSHWSQQGEMPRE